MEYLERMETMETMKERTKEKTKERAKIRKPCIRLHGHAFYFDEHTHTHTHTHARACACNPLQGPSLFFSIDVHLLLYFGFLEDQRRAVHLTIFAAKLPNTHRRCHTPRRHPCHVR